MRRLEEDRAAALAAFAVGALADLIDKPGAGDGLRDYDLVFDDCHREPLEITADAHAPTVQSGARMADGHFAAPELDRFWSIDPGRFEVDEEGRERPIDVRRIRQEAPRHLRVLEEHDVSKFNALLPSREGGKVGDATAGLVALGIKHAYSHRPPPSEHRLFIAAGAIGYEGADLPAEAIERQASDPGNQRKLDGDAPRRHLLVVPTLSGGDTGFAVFALQAILGGGEGGLPRLPQLPEAITTAWAFSDSGAIFVTPPAQWQVVRTPDGFWDRYTDWLAVGDAPDV